MIDAASCRTTAGMARKVPQSPTPAQVAAQANEYLDAAREHLARLQPLHDSADYALCIYVAGLSVKCLLRAYRYRTDPRFSARHDLTEVAKASGFTNLFPAGKGLAAYRAALEGIRVIWSSNDRFRPVSSVRRQLKVLGFDRRHKGDFLRRVSANAVGYATLLVTLGDRQWTRKPD